MNKEPIRYLLLPTMLFSLSVHADKLPKGVWAGAFFFADAGRQPIDLEVDADGAKLHYGDGQVSRLKDARLGDDSLSFSVKLHDLPYHCLLDQLQDTSFKGHCSADEEDHQFGIMLQSPVVADNESAEETEEESKNGPD